MDDFSFYGFSSYEEMKAKAEKVMVIEGKNEEWYIVPTGKHWVIWNNSGKSKIFEFRGEALCYLRFEFEEEGEGEWLIGEPELPELLGSPKQVAWADEIRREIFRLLDRCRDVLKQAGKWDRSVQKEYLRAKRWVYRQFLAVELIRRFRFLTSRKPDRQKIDDLRKGFEFRILSNLAERHWIEVTGED